MVTRTRIQRISRIRFGWKPIPSEARVTRDEVSGLQLRRKELSGRQYQHKQNLRAHRYATTTNVQNLSRITLMRRILSFSRISFNPVLPLDIWFTTDCICAYTALDSLQQEIIRDNHSARQAQTNHNRKNKSVKEQIRRIRVIRDRFWTRRESRRRKSLSIRYCLPYSPPRHCFNPETSSRVTLASLDIGFQPNLPSIQLNHKTTKPQNN